MQQTVLKVVMIGVIAIVLINYNYTLGNENYWATNGPFEARVQTIAINPNNSQNILIGTVENGIYKTDNGGENWVSLECDILPSIIRKIEFHPLAPETLYTCTIQGFYRSTDSGYNWQLITLPMGWQFEIETFALCPSQPNIIFIVGASTSGINYKSVNGGETWEELDMPPLTINNFDFNSLNDSIVYITTYSSSSGQSVYRSNNLGTSWFNIHNNLDSNLIIQDISIDPVDTSILYVCGNIFSGNTNRCVFKSDNSGQSWFDITPDSLLENFCFSTTVSPFNHETIYLCTLGNGVLKSNDGGLTWNETNTGITGRHMKEIVVDTANGIYYLGTYYDGIYRSIDGEIWQKISNNINNARVNFKRCGNS
jgi:photosystem II stability/assembly factor-like uncharacterized protein